VLFSLALATGTGEPASAPGVFVDHLRPKCWCQLRGALSQTGIRRRSSIREPYLGKVRFQSAFGRAEKWPLDEYLPPTSTRLNADHTGIHADHTGIHADHTGIHADHTGIHADHIGIHAGHTLRERGVRDCGPLST
jgi:hypothetical protein